MYRSLLSLSSFIFVKPIRSTFDPTYTCRIIVHGCLLGHYSLVWRRHFCVLPRDTKMAAGNRKKTSGVHFCQKRGLFSLLNFRKFRQMFLLILTLFRMLKIAGRVILKIRNSSATTILLMSRTMKIRKLKLFYCQKNARYRA